MGNKVLSLAPALRCGAFVVTFTLASACTTAPLVEPEPIALDLYDPLTAEAKVISANEGFTAGPNPTSADAEGAKKPNKLIYYRGRAGALAQLSADNEDRLHGRMLQLNFVNAPAGDAARTILRDALGETLSIADGVSGVITLSAPEPVSARDALDAMELALAESNLALIDTDSGFLLTTLDDAAQTPQAPRPRAAVGFSTTIVPVRYGVPSDIVRLIEPFLTSRVTLTPDDQEGAIVVRGPNVDSAEALDAIETFDAPYLTDRVFGLFKIEFAEADTIKTEVESLLAASGSPTGGGTALIALPRLNLLFVSARTSDAFAETRGWIERFDQPSGGDERRLRYYRVRYTPADALSAQLNAAFGGGGAVSSSFGAGSGGADLPGIQGLTNPGQPQRQPQRQSSFAAPPALSDDRASITPDTLNNALLIRATDQEYAEILDLIEKMDRQAAQVLIEATIAEVTLTDDLAFGVRWFFDNAESSLDFSDAGTLGPVFPGLNYSFIDGNVGAALNTLASVTDVTVLSAPSIMVLNNQSANLQVGDEVPIVTQQSSSVEGGNAPIVSNLQLRETGVILEVKPRINASDVVVLEVTQEVSDVTQTTTSGIDSPTIQQRRFTSTVAVSDKGTAVLGGLIRETYTDNNSGVPVLKDIPVLGYAFKSRDITKRRTELLVFLTPHIIRNESDATDAFKRLRREMRYLYNDAAKDTKAEPHEPASTN